MYNCVNTLLSVWVWECVWSEHSLVADLHLLPCLTQGLVGCCCAVHTDYLAYVWPSGDFSVCNLILLQSPGIVELCWLVQMSIGSEIQTWVLIFTQQVTYLLSHLSSLNSIFYVGVCTGISHRGKISGMIKHAHHAWLFMCVLGDWTQTSMLTRLTLYRPSQDSRICCSVDSLALSPTRIFTFISVNEDWVM